MKTLRALGTFAHFSIQTAGAIALPVLAGALLVACADENDPKTWVKRLDDPAQRAPAIKRLSQFFEDTMTNAKKNRDAPEVKALLDEIVVPMTTQYTAGNLDDKTRKELMKSLGDMRDPRTAPALSKALADYDPGKNDEDVKYASQAIIGMTQLGRPLDQSLVDALWGVFSKFRLSQAKSVNLFTDLHDAVLAVKSPSFGPKAVEKLAGAVDPKSPESMMDQVKFWQLTSIQVIKDLRFTPAVKPLVKVLLTPEKRDLWSTVEAALLHMPKEAEPVLASIIKGDDPELVKMAAAFGEDKSHIALACDALAWISRPLGRDAVYQAAGAVSSDTNRQALGMAIVRFPADNRSLAVFRGLYDGIKGNEDSDLAARAGMLQASSQFYDPSLVGWLLKEIGAAKGDSATALQLPALEAAIKLMTPETQRAVGDVAAKIDGQMQKIGSQQEKGTAALLKTMYDGASVVLGQCKADAACYVKVLEEPIATGKDGANNKAIKAAWMSVIYAGGAKDRVRADLVAKVDKVKNPGARLAVVEAIDRLAPNGDAAAAGALDKILEADRPTGDKMLLQADESLAKVAERLRARAN